MSAGPTFPLGARVVVKGKEDEFGQGTVRFCGEVKFGPGIWVGIELDEPRGRNDGFVRGERYFTCEPNKGIILKSALVEAIAAGSEKPAVAAAPAAAAAASAPTSANNTPQKAPAPTQPATPQDATPPSAVSTPVQPAQPAAQPAQSQPMPSPSVTQPVAARQPAPAAAAPAAAPASAPAPSTPQPAARPAQPQPAAPSTPTQAPRTPTIAPANGTPQRPAGGPSPARPVGRRDDDSSGSESDTPSKSKEAASTVQLANLVSVQTKKLRHMLASAQGRPDDYKKYLDDMVKTNEDIEKEVKRVRLRNVELERRSSQLESDVMTATKQLHDVLVGNLSVEEQANAIKNQAGSYAQQLEATKAQQAKTLTEAQKQVDDLRAQLAQLSTQLTNASNQLSSASNQLTSEKQARASDAAAFQERLDALDHQLQSSQTELVQKHQQELAAAAQKHAEEIAQLNAAHARQVEETKKAAEAQLAATVAKFEAELRAVKDSVLSQRAELAAVLSERSGLSLRLQTADQRVTELVSRFDVHLSFEADKKQPEPSAVPVATVVAEPVAHVEEDHVAVEPAVEEPAQHSETAQVPLSILHFADEQPVDQAVSGEAQDLPVVANPAELESELSAIGEDDEHSASTTSAIEL